jgi:hypothetical protein
VVALHELFGKFLAGLESGSVSRGTENSYAVRTENASDVSSQWTFRADNDKVNVVFTAECCHLTAVFNVECKTFSLCGNAWVSRNCIEFSAARGTGACFHYCMFAAAAAENKHIQFI